LHALPLLVESPLHLLQGIKELGASRVVRLLRSGKATPIDPLQNKESTVGAREGKNIGNPEDAD